MLLKAENRAVEAATMAGGWGGLPGRVAGLLWGTYLDLGGESGLEQKRDRRGLRTAASEEMGKEAEGIREAGG